MLNGYPPEYAVNLNETLMISYKENFMLDYSCENYKNEEALYIEK